MRYHGAAANDNDSKVSISADPIQFVQFHPSCSSQLPIPRCIYSTAEAKPHYFATTNSDLRLIIRAEKFPDK